MKNTGLLSLAAALFFCAHVSWAATVGTVGAATDEFSGSSHRAYFPIKGLAPCDQSHVFPGTLSVVDPALAGSFIQLSVLPSKTLSEILTGGAGHAVNSGDLSIRVEAVSSSNTLLPLYDNGAGFNNNLSTEVNYGNVENLTRTFGVYFQNNGGATGLCQLNGIWNAGVTNCQAGGFLQPSITLKVGIVKAGQTFESDSNADTDQITVTLVDCPAHATASTTSPTLNAPAVDFALAPGDSRLSITNNSVAPSDPIPLKDVVVYGTSVSATATFSNSTGGAGGFQASIGTGNGVKIGVDGLGNDTQYCVGIGYVNKGGLVTTDGGWSGSLPSMGAIGQRCVTPSRVDGFLDRSKCFIASAAYGEEWDSRLEILRQFRDRVLLKSSMGRGFVGWYYGWSPAAAHWIWGKPVVRFLVRGALFPVVVMSAFALEAVDRPLFSASLLFLWAGVFLAWLWMKKGKRRAAGLAALFVLAAGALTLSAPLGRAEDLSNVEPHIESLRKKYGIRPKSPETETAARPSSPRPAQETGAEASLQPYIDKIKREIQEKEDEKKNSRPLMPEDSIQPYIESVKRGRELEPKYRSAVRNGAGLSVMVTSAFDVKSNSVKANDFESVYDTKSKDKYVPGVDLFYEHQFYRDTTFGSLGAVTHLKVIVARGKGVFTKRQLPSDDTRFRFTAVPVTLGGGYRFLLGRFIVPFAQAALAGVPMLETRDDQKPSRRSLSFGYDSILGLALNLDWLGRRDAWNRYDSHGILHTYLTLQWERMKAFGGPVSFSYNALFGGFGFEF